MKKFLILLITFLMLCMTGCTMVPVPMAYALEPTPVTVTNPVTINPPSIPAAPGDISVSGITDAGATVSWYPVATASQYSVWINGSRWTGADSPGVTIHGLQPYNIYDVYVTATNESGESAPSSTASFSTLPPAPTAPSIPTVASVKDNTALVQWEPLPPWQYIQAYRVYVDGTAVADITPQEGTQTAELTNLPSGNHTVSVVGVNANREGESSQPAQFNIQTIPPITGLKTTNHSPDTIWFRWDAAYGADKYNISVNGQLVGETRQNDYVLSGLQAGQKYQVGVMAVAAEGNRSQMTTIQVETVPAAVPVTKDSLMQAIFAYGPDIIPGMIVLFAVGAAFTIARVAKEPFMRRAFIRFWR